MDRSVARPFSTPMARPCEAFKREMAKLGTPEDVAPGQHLSIEGDQSDSLILILSGEVEMFGSDVQDGRSASLRLGEGDLIGEEVISAVRQPARCPAFARALSRVRILRVGAAQVAGMQSEFERELSALRLAGAQKLVALAPSDELTQVLKEALPQVKDASIEMHHDGEVLFEEGSPSGDAYVILTGSIRITKQVPDDAEGMLARLRPGQLFGEASYDGEVTRKASAVAECPSCVLKLPINSLLDLMEKHDYLRELVEKQKTYYSKESEGRWANTPLSRMGLAHRMVFAGAISAMTIAGMTGPAIYGMVSSSQISATRSHLVTELSEDEVNVFGRATTSRNSANELAKIALQSRRDGEDIGLSYSNVRDAFYIPDEVDVDLPLHPELEEAILDLVDSQVPAREVLHGKDWGPSIVHVQPLQDESGIFGSVVSHLDLSSALGESRLGIELGDYASPGSAFPGTHADLAKVVSHGNPETVDGHLFYAVSDHVEVAGEKMLLTRWANVDHIGASLDRLFWLILELTGMSAVLGGVVGYALSYWISGPVRNLTHALERLAKGQRSVNIPHMNRNDTLGKMAVAIKVLQDSFRRQEGVMTDRVLDQQNKIERQERTRRQIADFEATFGSYFDEFMKSVQGLNIVSESLLRGASQASEGVDGITRSFDMTQDLVSQIQTQADEMRNRNHLVEQTTKASQRSTEKTVEITQEADRHLASLLAGVRKVATFAGTIGSIAEKTRILALNASIEASKAGVSGAGFAVVAQEVESLSRQTSHATAEIEAKIRYIEDSSESVDDQLKQVFTRVSRLYEEQNVMRNAIRSQSGAIDKIMQDVAHTFHHTKVTNRNLSAINGQVSTSEDVARDLTVSAGILKRKSEQWREDIKKFLASVRE